MRKGKTELLFILLTACLFFLLGNIFSTSILVPPPIKINHSTDSSRVDTTFYPLLKAEINKLYHSKISTGFSGAVVVAHRGNIVFENYKSLETKRVRNTITHNSRYQIASISKQFTAIAILQLYEKGLLQLNDTIQKYIPEFPYQDITIHQLLCHRSGLPNYIYMLDKMKPAKDLPITGDSLLRLMIQSPPERYSIPGKRFRYSNTGYVTLALIVERITGQPFYTYLKNNLFEPAGMMQTELLSPQHNDHFPDMLIGYSSHGADSREDFLNGCYGDKGIWSTARDLILWDIALYDTVIVKPSTLELAFQPHGMPPKSKYNYGYGWRIATNNKQNIYYHTGWWQGFKTLLMRFPENQITVVILKNSLIGSMFYRDEITQVINRSLMLRPQYDHTSESDSTEIFDQNTLIES